MNAGTPVFHLEPEENTAMTARHQSFCLLLAAFAACCHATGLTISVGESPFSADSDVHGDRGKLVNLILALDQVNHTHSKIVLRPFARSLKETAEHQADIHIPLIEVPGVPPPPGLAYVTDVDMGRVNFVIYSRKVMPYTAASVAHAGSIEVEPGHQAFFPFATLETHCVPCSLKKVNIGRLDAMIVSSDIIDPLLSDPQYHTLQRALYHAYTVRALVPSSGDTQPARTYLIHGLRQLQRSGQFNKITHNQGQYQDWQP